MSAPQNSVSEIQLTLPDGSVKTVPSGTTGFDVAKSIGSRLANDALAIKLDGEVTDLHRPIVKNAALQIITPYNRDKTQNPDALYCVRHSAAHVLAEALLRLWPQTKLVYGPPVDDGFYYDIDLDHKISTEEFAKIEAEMKKIVEEKRVFTRVDMPRDAGMAKVKAEGNPYKLENAERAQGDLSFYVTGKNIGTDFEDLCRGPHVPDTGRIGAFKVMSIAGAYLHGDQTKKQLQRVYGTAFPSQKDLDEHLNRIEEAKRRDHRVIGKQLGLFALDNDVGQGLILWLPKGATIRNELQSFMSTELTKRGYKLVNTPHIMSVELFKTSGHFPYYQKDQYPTIKMSEREEGTLEEYLLKPMNCPGHICVYRSSMNSYRDLPMRLAEFGTVYRYEKSGQLNGMTRVRGFTQDDAHIFCMPEQVEGELRSMIELTQLALKTLGLQDIRVQVSLRAPGEDKYVGAPEDWDNAENTLKRLVKEMGLPHTLSPGDAAFYGPKIDFMIKDCIGREWQLGTVQLDYNLPKRFSLEYVGKDNARHRPVMIHRAPFGSFERFCAILIEHFAGSFPFWLAPIQVYVGNISDKVEEHTRQVIARLKDEGFRVDEDLSSAKINGKVKDFELSKIPYMLVIGEREAVAESVAVRGRHGKNLGVLKLNDFIEKARAQRSSRSLAEDLT
jgi:threonyl-tRNA synthetase